MHTEDPPLIADYASGDADPRLFALVGVHAILCASPMLILLIPENAAMLPLLWAASSPGMGTLMTLSFWLGLGGGGRFSVRFVIAAIGAAYVALWSTLINFVQNYDDMLLGDAMNQFGATAAPMGAMVAVFGLGFLVARKWVVLVKPATPDDESPRDWLKYSVFHLLAAMTLCAVVLMFVQLSRSENAARFSLGQMLIVWIMGFSFFFANTLFAALAALGRKPLLPRIAITLAVATALGVAFSLSARHDRVAWWLVPCGSLIVIIPTSIVIASLLVVRWCGYRLVRRVGV